MAEKKRAIEILISGEASPKLTSAFSKAEGLLKKYKSMLTGVDAEQSKVDRGARKAGEGVKGFGGSVVRTIAGYAAAYIGIEKLGEAYHSIIEETQGAYRAHTRLVTLMKNVKGTTMGQIEAIGMYSDKLQEHTTIDENVTKVGASQLATFQLQYKSIRKLLPAWQDLSVGTFGTHVSEEQAIKSANMLGKVFSGQVGALKRVGVSFSDAQGKVMKTGTESQKVAMLIKVINQNYGTLARKMAQTPEGRVIRLHNAWAHIEREIGYKLIPIQEKLVKYLLSHMPEIQETIMRVVHSTQKWSGNLKPVWDRLVKLGNYVKRNWSWIMPTLKVIIGLYALWKTAVITLNVAEIVLNDTRRVAMAVTKGYTFASAAYAAICQRTAIALATERMAMLVYAGTTKSATAAQLLLNLAVEVNPFVALATAILAAAAAMVVLIKKYQEMRDAQEKAKQDEKNADANIARMKDYQLHGNHSIKKQAIAAARAKALASQHRANGGPVASGRSYLVGERGPELFAPAKSGFIIPNLALAGAGGLNVGGITINVQGGNSAQVASGIKSGTDYLIAELHRIERDRSRRSFS